MENKKQFNKEMFNNIKKTGSHEDEYYKYIVINKNIVLKGWKTSYLTSLKYEFYGMIDAAKKDIINIDNIEEVQKEYIKEAEEEATNEIIKNYDYYINIQKDAFNEKIKNEDFKKSILYYYIDNYSSNNFNELFIKDVKIEDFKSQLINKIVSINKTISNEIFFKKYIEESKSDIINQFKQNIFDGFYLNEWDFNYNWNNGIEDAHKIPFNFNNNISLKLNKIDLILKEYQKIINNPSEELKKAKLLYKQAIDFKNKYNNKTCNLYLNDSIKLKVLDFEYLTHLFETGQAKYITYRLFTTPDRNALQKYNEEANGLTREDDLFIKDIKKLVFNNNVIYEEKKEV